MRSTCTPHGCCYASLCAPSFAFEGKLRGRLLLQGCVQQLQACTKKPCGACTCQQEARAQHAAAASERALALTWAFSMRSTLCSALTLACVIASVGSTVNAMLSTAATASGGSRSPAATPSVQQEPASLQCARHRGHAAALVLAPVKCPVRARQPGWKVKTSEPAQHPGQFSRSQIVLAQSRAQHAIAGNKT